MRSILYYTPILFLLPLSIYAQAPQWANYVNDHIINAVALDGDNLWVGSQGGLTKINRVTGEKQSFLPSNSGMKGHGVQSILIDDDGTKWIGGAKGGLMRFDDVNWESFQYINTGDTLIEISKIVRLPNGDLWLKSTVNGSCGGCPKNFRYDGSSFERMEPNLGLGTSGSIQDFDAAPNGDVWVYAYTDIPGFQYTIQQFDGNNVVQGYSESDVGLLADEYISKILVSASGVVYCLTSQYISQTGRVRLRKLEGGIWSLVPIQGADFATGYPYSFFKSDDGSIWFQLYNDANNLSYFKRFDGVNWQGWNSNNLTGLPAGYNNPPNLLLVDEMGHWWLEHYTLAGIHGPKLFEYDGTSFQPYDTEIFPMMFNYVEATKVDCEGNTWFGGGGLNKFDGTEWTEYDHNDVGASINVWSMTMDYENCVLWAASYGISGNFGVVSYDGATFKTYDTGGDAFKVEIAPDGTKWVATAGNGLGHFDGTNWQWYNENNSPLDNWVHSVDSDPFGGVWVTAYGKGLMHYDGNNWQVFNQSNSPVYNYPTLIYVDMSGIVWTHSQEGDLLRFDGQNWQTIQTVPQGFVYRITEESPGNYWIAVNGGILFWDGNTFEKYDVANSKIGSNSAWDIDIDPYGNKWFCNSAGVSVFNENGISTRLINPPNSISGTVFFDTDQDGVHDAVGEPGIPGQQIALEPENLVTYSTYGGHYKMHPLPGNYQINIQPDAPYLPTTTNPLNLLMGNNNQSGLDFGAWADKITDSIGLELTAGVARCSETTSVWLQVTNFGLFDVGGTATLNFDPLLDFVSADPPPTMINSYSLTWDFNGLSPYEYRPIVVTFQNPNADFVGEWLDVNAVVILDDNETTATDVDATELRCSFDPNEKLAWPTGESVAQYSLSGDALDYTIFFQNKGNDTAFIVVVRDTLDANLDPASFQLLASSHPVRIERKGLVLTFFFENINLLWETFDEPASHGFVRYRIKATGGIPDPTDIENTAHIYFDFNPAIVTNTTVNTLVEELPFLGTNEPVTAISVRVFPNPNNGSFNIDSSNEGSFKVTITDLTGKIIRTLKSSGNTLKVDGLDKGFYLLAIWQNNQSTVQKVVVGK